MLAFIFTVLSVNLLNPMQILLCTLLEEEKKCISGVSLSIIIWDLYYV